MPQHSVSAALDRALPKAPCDSTVLSQIADQGKDFDQRLTPVHPTGEQP